MSFDTDEPVCVIDIDVSFINDYMDLINYPIERGQFVATQSWWKDTDVDGYKLQGGFQKYYPKDCRFIYDKFVADPKYWMEYYIKNGTTVGPVNGEQYFVEDCVREKLDLKFVPAEWITRWEDLLEYNPELLVKFNTEYPGDWLYLGGEFNPDVRLLHFQGLNRLHSAKREARGW